MVAEVAERIEGTLTFTPDGGRQTRILNIKGLSGNAPAHRIMYDALLTPGVPQLGDAHPSIPGLRVLELSADKVAEDRTRASVTVQYGVPRAEQQRPDETAPPVIGIGSNVTQAETEKDKDGRQLTVSLNTTDGNTLSQTGSLQIQVPQTTVEYSRKENGNPLEKSLTYTGKVNRGPVGRFAARTLLCKGIRGTSDDNGLTYNVSYNFEYREGTWDAEAVYIDNDTDKPHPDVTLQPPNGVLTARIYKEVDFGPLNIF